MLIKNLKKALDIFESHQETAITIEPDFIYGGVTEPGDMPEAETLVSLGWIWDSKIGLWKYPLYQNELY